MTTLEQRITETLAEVDAAHKHDFRDACPCGEVIFKDLGQTYGDQVRAHLNAARAAALGPAIREAQAEAVEAEARNLRELHTLIEDTPWNPMPAEDKTRCINFMDEAGVDDHEYTDRKLNNYATWLDHRAQRIRSNDE